MNTQKPLKVKVSITLDEDVIHQIRALAETDDRNFSQYINLVLSEPTTSTNDHTTIYHYILFREPSRCLHLHTFIFIGFSSFLLNFRQYRI